MGRGRGKRRHEAQGSGRGGEKRPFRGRTRESSCEIMGKEQHHKEVVDAGETPTTSVCRDPKYKYAVVFGYLGTGYKGLQKQATDVRTVEGVLERALHKAGGISRENFGDLRKVQWSRAARTDKGVHAACQVVCLRLVVPGLRASLIDGLLAVSDATHPTLIPKVLIASSNPMLAFPQSLQNNKNGMGKQEEKEKDEKGGSLEGQAGSKMEKVDEEKENSTRAVGKGQKDGSVPAEAQVKALEATLVARVNEELKEEDDCMRVFKIYRVTKAFDARLQSSKRTYKYVLPVERLRKVIVTDRARAEAGYKYHFEMTEDERKSVPVEEAEAEVSETWKSRNGKRGSGGGADDDDDDDDDDDNHDYETGKAEHEADGEIRSENGSTVPVAEPEGNDSMSNAWFQADEEWEFTDSELERINLILSKYVGTRNFSNFTSRVPHGDATTERFIESIETQLMRLASPDGKPDEVCLLITIKGQSFLYNQIRKMIGLVIEVFRGTAPLWAMEESLDKRNKRYTHVAPGEGLYLWQVHYDSYSQFKAKPPHTPKLTFEDTLEQREAFEREQILPEIARQGTSAVWTLWLGFVDRHPFFLENYPPRRVLLRKKKEASL